MKLQRPNRSFFKGKHVKSMIVWYLILLGAIIVLAWKMKDIVSLF